jgi:hypothetical protein
MSLTAVVNQSISILDVSPGSAGHDGVNGCLGNRKVFGNCPEAHAGLGHLANAQNVVFRQFGVPGSLASWNTLGMTPCPIPFSRCPALGVHAHWMAVASRHALGMLARRVLVSLRRPSRVNHVTRVLRGRSLVQMGWVATRRIVATMKRERIGKSPISKGKRNSVRSHGVLVDVKLPVSILVAIPTERPTRLRASGLINLGPKQFLATRGNIGVHRGASYGAKPRLLAQRGAFFCSPNYTREAA